MTTIHDPRQYVLSNHKRPKKTSTNAATARKPFAEDEHQKLLPIPDLVSDYNQYLSQATSDRKFSGTGIIQG